MLQTHLPGYVGRADDLKNKGIAEIVCVSVNDPFVMDAWGKEHKADGKVSCADQSNGKQLRFKSFLLIK